jgi:hypothetical protein
MVDEVFNYYGFSRPDAAVYSSLVEEVWREYRALRDGL